MAGAERRPRVHSSGNWSGSYQAIKHDPLLGENQGQQIAWVKDKGELFTGPGQLHFMIDAQGRLSGTADGALGITRLAGQASDASVHLSLQPPEHEPAGFNGTATGAFKGERLVLELRAVSADGRFVRAASATLGRAK